MKLGSLRINVFLSYTAASVMLRYFLLYYIIPIHVLKICMNKGTRRSILSCLVCCAYFERRMLQSTATRLPAWSAGV